MINPHLYSTVSPFPNRIKEDEVEKKISKKGRVNKRILLKDCPVKPKNKINTTNEIWMSR